MTDRWRDRGIPVPYSEVWDFMRREHPRRWAGGVPVRIESYGNPIPPMAAWSNLESVTTTHQRFVLHPHEVLDRVCGIVDREVLYRVERGLDEYSRGTGHGPRPRALCREHREAFDLITGRQENGSVVAVHPTQLSEWQYLGIPVHDPYYISAGANVPEFPERGCIRIAPAELFQAMNVCRVTTPEHLVEFMLDCRRMDSWDRHTTWSSDGSVRNNPITLQTLEMSRAEIEAMYQPFPYPQGRFPSMPSMMVTGAMPQINTAYYGWVPAGDNQYGYEMLPRSPEQEAVQRKAMAEAAEARVKALALLERVVQPAEFESFKTNKHIELTGKKYRYRIKQAGQTALYGLKSGKVEFNACLQLTGATAPSEDRVVMEYLMIRNKENKYLKEANLFPTGESVGMDSVLSSALNALGRSLGGLGSGIMAGVGQRLAENQADAARLQQGLQNRQINQFDGGQGMANFFVDRNGE